MVLGSYKTAEVGTKSGLGQVAFIKLTDTSLQRTTNAPLLIIARQHKTT